MTLVHVNAWIRRHLLDVICVVVVTALALKLCWSVERIRDLGLNDETLYLASGVQLFQPGYPNTARGLPASDWGPLYSLWYASLHLLVRDRVRLYDVNWTLLIVCTSVAFYALVRLLKGSTVVALLTTFLLLTSAYFDVWPFPNHFAVLVLLVGALFVVRARDPASSIRRVLFTLLLCAYVRPEFFSAFLLAVLLCLAWYVRRLVKRRATPRELALVFLPVAGLAVLFFVTIGIPVSGDRAWYAVAQHYALNKVLSREVDANPWINWYAIYSKDFGKNHTILTAISANPSAFLWHIKQNLMHFTLWPVVAPRLDLPETWEPYAKMVYKALLALGIIGLALRLLQLRRAAQQKAVTQAGGGFKDAGPALAGLGLIVLVVAAATTVSVVLIHPRPHYLMPIGALLMALTGAHLRWLRPSVARPVSSPDAEPAWPLGWHALGITSLCAFLACVTPSRAYGLCLQDKLRRLPEPPRNAGEVRKTVAAIRQLGISGHVTVLEPDWGYAFFGNVDHRRVDEWNKQKPFFTFLADENISVVVITSILTFDRRNFSEDPEFQAFLREPGKYGFRVVDVQGTPNKIALRQDVRLAADAPSGTNGNANERGGGAPWGLNALHRLKTL